jgi:hypothetical protein
MKHRDCGEAKLGEIKCYMEHSALAGLPSKMVELVLGQVHKTMEKAGRYAVG